LNNTGIPRYGVVVIEESLDEGCRRWQEIPVLDVLLGTIRFSDRTSTIRCAEIPVVENRKMVGYVP
jgi:hypothetical protein